MADLRNIEDFAAEFYRQIPLHRTHTAAYDATEQKHIQQTGTRRYSSYESFRQVMRRRILRHTKHRLQ